MAALPAVILLGFVFLINKQALLVSIIFLRASMDPVLETTKIPLGNTSMGLGGVLNGLIILLVLFSFRAEHRPYMRKAGWLALPLFLILLASIFWSAAVADAIKQYLALVTYASMFVLGVIYAEKWGVDRVLKLVLYAGSLPILLGVMMLLMGHRGLDGRFAGPFEHANMMAFFMLNTAVAALYFRGKAMMAAEGAHEAINKVAVNLILFGALLMLVMSQTRSAWAAASLVLLLYSVFFERRLIPVLIGVGALLFFVPAVQDRLLDLRDSRSYLLYSQLNSYDWRLVLWRDAINTIQSADLLVGAGFGSFMPDSLSFFSLSNGVAFGAHSVYVQLLYETGLPGLLAFVLILIS